MKAFKSGLCGFVIHLIPGVGIPYVLVDFLDDRLYAGYTFFLMMPLSALACGIVGINSGALCHRGDYRRAARGTASVCAVVAAIILAILFAGGAPHWAPFDHSYGR